MFIASDLFQERIVTMNHVASRALGISAARPPNPLIRGASRACGIPVAVSGVSPGTLIQWFMERNQTARDAKLQNLRVTNQQKSVVR
jgi:hypothetical protein